MPDQQNSPMRNWARRVSIDAGQSAHTLKTVEVMLVTLLEHKIGLQKLA